MQRGLAPVLIILAGLLLLAVGVGGYVLITKPQGPINSDQLRPQEKACTLEAMVCPDGSSVGRTGPNCEFAACPSVKPAASSSANLLSKPDYELLKLSPDGKLKIGQYKLGDSSIIDILDKDGKVLEEDILQRNYSKMGYGTKFDCQCGTHFKTWVNNTTFTLQIVNALDEEFEYQVDATTGLVDETSFKKIK